MSQFFLIEFNHNKTICAVHQKEKEKKSHVKSLKCLLTKKICFQRFCGLCCKILNIMKKLKLTGFYFSNTIRTIKLTTNYLIRCFLRELRIVTI